MLQIYELELNVNWTLAELNDILSEMQQTHQWIVQEVVQGGKLLVTVDVNRVEFPLAQIHQILNGNLKRRTIRQQVINKNILEDCEKFGLDIISTDDFSATFNANGKVFILTLQTDMLGNNLKYIVSGGGSGVTFIGASLQNVLNVAMVP